MKMVCFVLHLILIGFIKYLQYFAATIIFSGNVFAPHLQIKMYKHRQLVNQTLPGSFHPLRHSSRTATKQRHEKHTCLVRQSCYRLQASHRQLKCPGNSSRVASKHAGMWRRGSAIFPRLRGGGSTPGRRIRAT